MEWTPEEIKSFKVRHGLTGDSMAATLGVLAITKTPSILVM